MTLELFEDDVAGFRVDRDGSASHYPRHARQGFNVYLPGLTIHFEDEQDAVNVAKAILLRMGDTV